MNPLMTMGLLTMEMFSKMNMCVVWCKCLLGASNEQVEDERLLFFLIRMLCGWCWWWMVIVSNREITYLILVTYFGLGWLALDGHEDYGFILHTQLLFIQFLIWLVFSKQFVKLDCSFCLFCIYILRIFAGSIRMFEVFYVRFLCMVFM